MKEGTIILVSPDELRTIINEAVGLSIKQLIQSTNQNKQEEDPFIKIDEVCQELKVTKVTIHKWKKAGKIPFHRISNRVFFKRSEVLSALTKSKHLTSP